MDYRLRRISSLWISAGELPAKGDLVVTIERITTEDVIGEGGRITTMGVLYFRGWKKGMPLNSGNGKTIRKLYGEDDDRWLGKAIALYRDKTNVGQERGVPCLRVRPEVPRTGRADQQPPELDEDDNTLVARVCRELEAAPSKEHVARIVEAAKPRIEKCKPELIELANRTRQSVLASLAKGGSDG